MSCPTCDAVMQNISRGTLSSPGDGYRQFWCPRCGTLKIELVGVTTCDAPQLVVGLRKVVELISTQPDLALAMELLRQAGVLESINVPGERHE
jgi:predicted RNA-binding Zn-ribbon protein involved in translation (DUF1610 family)